MEKKPLSFDASIDRIKEISAWISSVHDLNRFLDLILETATQMMNLKYSSLFLLDRKSKKLYFKVGTGEKKHDVKKFKVDMGQGIAGFVAQKGEALFIPDISKNTRWHKEIGESIGFQTRSIACLPMKVNGKIIGVIEAIDKKDGWLLQVFTTCS